MSSNPVLSDAAQFRPVTLEGHVVRLAAAIGARGHFLGIAGEGFAGRNFSLVYLEDDYT